MKRIIFALVTALILVSCASGDAPKISIPIRIVAEMNTSDSKFTALVTENECDIVFSDDNLLSGTKIHFSDSGSTASTGDFTREIKPETFPAHYALAKALRTIASENGIPTGDGSKRQYSLDESEILVYYEQEGNKLEKIEINERDRRFVFRIVEAESYEAQSFGAG